jgi:hypothetical protein
LGFLLLVFYFCREEELSKAFNDEQNESLILNKPSGKLPFDADRELVENLDRWIIQRSEQSPDPKDLKSRNTLLLLRKYFYILLRVILFYSFFSKSFLIVFL